MDVRYMAIDIERQLLTGRAERGWRVTEAAMARQRRASITGRARWLAGEVLVRLGGRVQGAPCPESPISLPAV